MVDPSVFAAITRRVSILEVGCNIELDVTNDVAKRIDADLIRRGVPVSYIHSENKMIITRLPDPVRRMPGRPPSVSLADLKPDEVREFEAHQAGPVRRAVKRDAAQGMHFETSVLPSGAIRVRRLAGAPPTVEELGHVRLSPFKTLEPGQSYTEPAGVNVHSVRRLASYYGKQLRRRFSVADRGADGCVITRIDGADAAPAPAPAPAPTPAVEAGDRRAEPRAPEPEIDVEEQKRLAAEVLAAAKSIDEDEF